MPTRSIGVQCSLIMAPRASTPDISDEEGCDLDITQSEKIPPQHLSITRKLVKMNLT